MSRLDRVLGLNSSGWQAGALTPLPPARPVAESPQIIPVLITRGWGAQHWYNIHFPEPSHVLQGLSPCFDSSSIISKPAQENKKYSFHRRPLQYFTLFFFFPPLQIENKFNRRQMHFMIFNNFAPWFNHSILRTSIKSVFKTNNST